MATRTKRRPRGPSVASDTGPSRARQGGIKVRWWVASPSMSATELTQLKKARSISEQVIPILAKQAQRAEGGA